MDAAPEPLYPHEEVDAAISRVYGIDAQIDRPQSPTLSRPTEQVGLALIDKWTRLEVMQPEPISPPRHPLV